MLMQQQTAHQNLPCRGSDDQIYCPLVTLHRRTATGNPAHGRMGGDHGGCAVRRRDILRLDILEREDSGAGGVTHSVFLPIVSGGGMQTYTLGIDAWEGSLEINEAEFRKGGVEFAFIRLNDMSGGHHKDTGFDKQWGEAADFIRAPYFVYNPWVSGSANYSYLRSILPAGVTAISLDVEVRYSGYSPTTYAQEVEKCIKLIRGAGMTPIIYTGGWFLGNLSYWLEYVDYWWAAYPYELYPEVTTYTTWDVIKAKLENISFWPDIIKAVPGPCALWQCSGDRYILPGTVRTLDINVFNGSPADMIARYKLPAAQVPDRLRQHEIYLPIVSTPVPEQPIEQPPAPPETILSDSLRFVALVDGQNVRAVPSVSGGQVRKLAKGEIVTASNVAGGDSWVEIAPGEWAAVRYNGTEYLRKVD